MPRGYWITRALPLHPSQEPAHPCPAPVFPGPKVSHLAPMNSEQALNSLPAPQDILPETSCTYKKTDEIFSPLDHSPPYFGGSKLQILKFEGITSESQPSRLHLPDSQCWQTLNWLFHVETFFLNHDASLNLPKLSLFMLAKY